MTPENLSPENTNNPSQQSLIDSISNNSPLSRHLERIENHKWKQFGLSYRVAASDFFVAVQALKSDPSIELNMLIDVTCVDWLDSKDSRFEMVYNFMSLKHNTRLCLKAYLSEDKPEIASLVSLWNSANFLEREVFDMYGIIFTGHPDLRRILMYEEFVGYPLRKDYPLKGKQPRVELRVPELHNSSEDLHRESLVSMPTRKYPTVDEKLARERVGKND